MPDLKVETHDMKIVREILGTHLPGYEVWAFGSRVHGENLKPFSDLDLAVITASPLDARTMAELKDAFSDSALPFKVDVLDWSVTDERFKKKIREEYVIVSE